MNRSTSSTVFGDFCLYSLWHLFFVMCTEGSPILAVKLCTKYVPLLHRDLFCLPYLIKYFKKLPRYIEEFVSYTFKLWIDLRPYLQKSCSFTAFWWVGISFKHRHRANLLEIVMSHGFSDCQNKQLQHLYIKEAETLLPCPEGKVRVTNVSKRWFVNLRDRSMKITWPL